MENSTIAVEPDHFTSLTESLGSAKVQGTPDPPKRGRGLDSSALVKVCHAEVGSSAVEELVPGSAVTILISRLSVVEVQSAFAGKVRAGVISVGDAAGLRRRPLEDIANGVFRVVALTSDHFDQAGELIER